VALAGACAGRCLLSSVPVSAIVTLAPVRPSRCVSQPGLALIVMTMVGTTSEAGFGVAVAEGAVQVS
jgi:hypothetical protein